MGAKLVSSQSWLSESIVKQPSVKQHAGADGGRQKLHCWLLGAFKFCVVPDKNENWLRGMSHVHCCSMSQQGVVQLQGRGPHVACHRVFSGPRKHSGNIFKSEICWNACERLHLSHWIACAWYNVHLHKNNE